jgi:hypothetical protein
VHPFRTAIEAQDMNAAIALLSEDVVFHSPIVFKAYHGRDAVAPILHAVSQVFEDFHYTREIGTPDSPDHVLVFRSRIGRIEIEGADFLHVDQNGSIDGLTVMVRPLSAAHALAEAMRAQLAAAQDGVGP